MTEQLEQVLARCVDCNKTYRVPHPDHSYACQACGGAVRVEEEHPHHHLEGALTCSKCKAVNHHGTHFCVECGTVLAPSPHLERDEELDESRREATNALRGGYRTIAGVTWLFRLGALAYGGVMLLAVFALARNDVPVEGGLLVVGLATLLTVLMLMGALQILFKPFVWTVVVAVLATLVSVAHLIGPNPLGLAFYWSAAWAVAFWISAYPTLKFQRLIAEHTDLYISHHASRRTKRALRGRTAQARHEKLVRAMHNAFMRSWKVSAVAGSLVCIASVFGSYTVLAKLRPEEFETTLGQFEATWNSGDLQAIAEFFAPQVRDHEAAWVGGLVDGHGWKDSLPELEGGVVRHGEERTYVDYELGDTTMSAGWVLDRRTWYLVEIELPLPPLEPTFERFLEAWDSSEPAQIAAFYPPDYVDKMTTSIERSAGFRDWVRFPEIQETDLSSTTERKAVVVLTVEDGEVTTKWLFRSSGRWCLQAIEFPQVKKKK